MILIPKKGCNEIKYDCEWRKLGYGNARLVARGQRKTCKGLHFVQAEETK